MPKLLTLSWSKSVEIYLIYNAKMIFNASKLYHFISSLTFFLKFSRKTQNLSVAETRESDS